MSLPTISAEERHTLACLVADLGLTRDYRKEVWIAAYTGCLAAGKAPIEAWSLALEAVKHFDKADFS